MTAKTSHLDFSCRVLVLAIVLLSGSVHAAQVSGCTIFPPDNPWNRDISNDPVHPNSNNYINAILTGSNKYLFADFAASSSYGIPFNVVSGTQAKVAIQIVDYPHESDPGPYPVPSGAKVEAGSDHHCIVLDKDNALLYEMFNASYVGPGWKCSSAAIFNLKTNTLRRAGWTSADAAGLPILPGLVKYDEVAAGNIDHALRFTVHVAQTKYVYPATHAGTSTNTNDPPMGSRLRLKASFDTSKYTGQARVILNALKKYGMFVADRGSDWYVSGAPDSRWNDADLRQLRTVPGSAFEVVNPNYGSSPTPTPTPTTPTVGTGTGLTGAYYDNKDFTGAVVTRTDATVNFDWGSNSPIGGIGADSFSVRWTGQIQPQYSQSYTFYTQSDDGVRLWVNGQLLINDWTDHGWTERSGTISLTAGQKYDIKLEYYDSAYGAVAKLLWASSSTAKAIIPTSQLYPSTVVTPTTPSGGTGTGLSATYFNSTTLSGTSVSRVDPKVDFNWSYNAPASGINADAFSVRWTGQVLAPITEYYTFYTQSNDGVRLWVNGVRLVDNWTNHSVVENGGGLWLTAGQRYSITMEYYDSSGEAVARLLWSAPGLAKAIIPQTQLYPSTTTTPTPTPSTGDGLMAVYFDNADLTGTTAARIDRTINFDWGTSAPITNIAADTFSTRWTGLIQPQYSQTYTFYTLTDDGVRLWVNNQLVVDRWRDQSATEASGTIALSAGVKYPIKMEYYDGWGGAAARLYWSSSSTPKQIVPQSQLYSGTAVEVPETIAEVDSSSFEGDSDRDGFSDELEVALGTSPTDASSTPLDDQPAGMVQPLSLKSLVLKMNFKPGVKDSLVLSGAIENTAATLHNRKLSISVGGVATTFILNEKGVAANELGSVKLTQLKGTADYKYEIKLNGELEDTLADEELSGTRDVESEPRTIDVLLLFNGTVYQVQPQMIYSARPGRTGKAFIKK